MELTLIENTSIERARFARLPRTLDAAIEAIRSGEAKEQDFIALEHAELTSEEYDTFTSNFREGTEWLSETGGWGNATTDAEPESDEWWKGAYHLCVKVTSPGKPTLYVDAQGQDRPIYVAVEENKAN